MTVWQTLNGFDLKCYWLTCLVWVDWSCNSFVMTGKSRRTSMASITSAGTNGSSKANYASMYTNYTWQTYIIVLCWTKEKQQLSEWRRLVFRLVAQNVAALRLAACFPFTDNILWRSVNIILSVSNWELLCLIICAQMKERWNELCLWLNQRLIYDLWPTMF